MKTPSEIWESFEALPGASFQGTIKIGSENAIDGLMKLIVRYRPGKVLELGAGIGTLTYTILETMTSLGLNERDDNLVLSVENDPFCIEQLTKNLQEFDGFYSVIQSPTGMDDDLRFDLIVVDGGGHMDGDMGEMSFANKLSERGIIFVEGGRSNQRQLVAEWYGNREFAYGKMPSLKQSYGADGRGMNPRYKPYHLFVFEPSSLDKLLISGKSYWRRKAAKAKRRWAAASPGADPNG